MTELQLRLLEKVEELTLYTVQQARMIRDQQGELDIKDGEIRKLRKRVEAIERSLPQRSARDR